MENTRPIRTIYFQIQGKGGTGKSFLSYLLANKFRHEKNTLFIDADTENKTSSAQNLKFLSPPTRLAYFSILDDKNKIQRDKITLMLDRFGKDDFPFEKVFIDMGATESIQLLRLFADDFEPSILKKIEEKYQLKFVFNVVIAGNTAFAACVSFLEKVQQIFQENHEIVIYANAEEFKNNYSQLENLKELGKLHNTAVKEFGSTEKNSTIGDEIATMMIEGKSIDDYPDMFAFFQMEKEFQQI
jgi:CobQ/CobB/MinD/ParA nucleotide binding domain